MEKNIVSRFKYVRIQGQELAENTMFARGIFSMCWDMIQNDQMDSDDAGLFKEIDDWFANVLPWPPQCMNQEKVICFFPRSPPIRCLSTWGRNWVRKVWIMKASPV